MHKDFFRNLKIFDGGTGQELINRGLIPQKNLWSATALLKASACSCSSSVSSSPLLALPIIVLAIFWGMPVRANTAGAIPPVNKAKPACANLFEAIPLSPVPAPNVDVAPNNDLVLCNLFSFSFL